MRFYTSCLSLLLELKHNVDELLFEGPAQDVVHANADILINETLPLCFGLSSACKRHFNSLIIEIFTNALPIVQIFAEPGFCLSVCVNKTKHFGNDDCHSLLRTCQLVALCKEHSPETRTTMAAVYQIQ